MYGRGSGGDGVRLSGEDGAHAYVLDEDFEVAGEAVQEEARRPARRGQRAEVLDEAEAGLRVLLHEVAHAVAAEVFEARVEEREREPVGAALGVARAAEERVEVFVEAARVLALEAQVFKNVRAVE